MSITLNGVKISDKSRKRLIIRTLLTLVECVLTVCLTIVLATSILFPEKIEAATGVSKILSYQGRLTDTNGNPLGGSGTNYCFRFSIYDASSAGSKLWPSGTPTSNTVNVVNGVFNIGIGEADDLSAFNFYSNDTVYLNIEVNETPATCDGDWESMAPRQRIDAVAYARVAGSVYGPLLRTDNDNNRVQLGDAGADPVRLLLGVKNTSDTIGGACSPSGIIWYNSNNTRALVCDDGTIQEIGNKGTIVGTAISGNTAGTPTTISSGTITLAGGANVTLSQDGNAITISAGTAGGGGSIGAISAGAGSVTSGTVVFSDSPTVTFGMDGQTITASAGAAGGGIAGIGASNTIFNSGTVVFSGGNNITVGTDDQKIIISAANQSVQTQNMVTVNNSTGAISISGGANVTVGNNANTITISVAAGGGGAAIQAGTQSVSTGTVIFSNSNGISFGMAGNQTITASYTVPTDYFSSNQSSNLMGTSERANYFATSNNTFFASANSTQLMNTSERANLQYTSANSNFIYASAGLNLTNISATFNSNSISLSGNPAQTVQTQNMVSVNNSTGAISIAGGELISVSNNANTISIRNVLSSATTVLDVGTASVLGAMASRFALEGHQHAGVPVAGISGGNVSGTTGTRYGSAMFAGGNNITLSGATGAGGQTVTVSGVSFSNANNVSFGMNAGTVTASASYPTGATATGNLGGLAVSGVASTFTSGTVQFSGGNLISISTAAGPAIVISNLLSTATTVRPVASASSIGSQSSYFALADHAHAGLWQISVGGNTQGNTSAGAGSFMLAGGNNITLAGATAGGGQTLSIIGGAGAGGIAGIGASNTTYVSGTVIFSGQANITLNTSVDGASQYVRLSVANPGGGGGATLSSFEPFPFQGTGTGSISLSSNTSAAQMMFPFNIPQYVAAEFMAIPVSMNFTTGGTSSFQQSGTLQWGLFTRPTGANSTRLSNAGSGSFSYAVTYNNSSITFSQPTSSNSTGYIYSTTASAGLLISSGYTGLKQLNLYLGSTIAPGQYWLGLHHRNSSSSFNSGIRMSLYGNSITLSALAPMGSFTTAYSTGTNLPLNQGGNWALGNASYSVAALTQLTTDVTMSQMTQNLTVRPYLKFGTRL